MKPHLEGREQGLVQPAPGLALDIGRRGGLGQLMQRRENPGQPRPSKVLESCSAASQLIKALPLRAPSSCDVIPQTRRMGRAAGCRQASADTISFSFHTCQCSHWGTGSEPAAWHRGRPRIVAVLGAGDEEPLVACGIRHLKPNPSALLGLAPAAVHPSAPGEPGPGPKPTSRTPPSGTEPTTLIKQELGTECTQSPAPIPSS